MTKFVLRLCQFNRKKPPMSDKIFWHKCVWSDCGAFIETDTHPWCVLHTPSSGPVVEGYSAREAVKSLAPYEIVTFLLNELVKQKNKDGQLRIPGMDDFQLVVTIDTAKVWLAANINTESRPALLCKAHLSGDAEA